MTSVKNVLLFCIVLLCLTMTHQEPIDNDRNLQQSAYPNMRIATDFQLLTAGTAAWRNYVQYQLIPAVVSYLQAALTIKYPSVSPISSTASKLCGFNTPNALKTGMNADMVVFFNSVSDSTGGWMAATTLCTTSSGAIKRPTIVNIGINTYAFDVADPVNSPLIHDLNINVIVHEFVHALGMNGPLYNSYVDANGVLLKNHVKKVKLAGITRDVLDLPPLTARLRSYTGCDTIPGLFMEDDGGAHIERRFFQWEIMTTGGIIGSKITFVTLGFLEGTGWYVPNYDYAEPYSFGQGQGCGFYADTVVAANYPNEYCKGNGIGCTQVGNGGGYCVDDELVEVGNIVTAQYEWNCENNKGSSYADFPTKEVYGRGLGSQCFTGNLTTAKKASQTNYCFKYTCQGTGTDTKIEVMWGTTKLYCNAAGPLTVSGYKGAINCPDPLTFCNTVGKVTCPRSCTGRGTCVEGKCVCNSGFQGTDCGFTI